jgi:hypothetical protein
MKNVVAISFHDSLMSKTVDLLEEEKMECSLTQAGIPELISQLQNYKEEGKSLFPNIFIFDDVDLIQGMIGNSQFCFIGKGEKSKETMLKALKKCAPLTENGWSIYILRTKEEFEYGVFHGGTNILSESPEEALTQNDNSELKVILIHQIAEKLIEIKGASANTLIVSYGSKASTKQSPLELQSNFITNITANVEPDLTDQTDLFYRKIFLEVLRRGHGTLACVVRSKSLPKKLSDGIMLRERVDIPKLIAKFNQSKDKDLASSANLESYFSLIVGMMQSDGITVFTDRGEVAAYNVFVKHPKKIAQSKTSGGARSRTFLTLSEYIGKGLNAAYIQSQDGKIEHKDGRN